VIYRMSRNDSAADHRVDDRHRTAERTVTARSDDEAPYFDAFLSYVHDHPGKAGVASEQRISDAIIARRLRLAMLTLATPRAARSDLQIYLDRSTQTPSADVWKGILGNLGRSRILVLLASPESAASEGVRREVGYWLSSGRTLEDIVIVLIRGDGRALDASLPPLLAQRWRSEQEPYRPHYVDLTWVTSKAQLELGHVQFRDAVAMLVARMRGVEKDTLVGDELELRERSRRRQRNVIAVLATLLVVALVAGTTALTQWQRARSEADIATARALAAAAEAQFNSDLELAPLLAVEAYRRDPNPQTRATLLQSVTTSPALVRFWHTEGHITALSGSDDGTVVVAGSDVGRLTRWTVTSDERTEITGLTGSVLAVAVSADGGTIAAIDKAGAVVWTKARGSQRIALPEGLQPTGVGLSPSGRMLLVSGDEPPSKAGAENTSVVVLLDRQLNRITQTPLSRPAADLVVPDETSAVSITEGTVWEHLTLPTLATTARSKGSISGAHDSAPAISPDGAFFSTTNGVSTIPLWPTTGTNDRDHPMRMGAAPGRAPEALAVSKGGRRTAIADTGTITVSDTVEVGRTPPVPLRTMTGLNSVNTNGLRFFGDSAHLLSASGDSVALWDLAGLGRVGRQVPIKVPYACSACGGPSIVLSPDGRQVAVIPQIPGAPIVVAGLAGQGPASVALSVANGILGRPTWSPDSKELRIPAPRTEPLDVHQGGEGGPLIGRFVSSAPGRQPGPIAMLGPAGPRLTLVDDAAIPVDPAQAEADHAVAEVRTTLGHGEPFGDNGPSTVLSPDKSLAAIIVNGDVVLVDVHSRARRTLRIGDARSTVFTRDRLLVQRQSGALEIRTSDSGQLLKTISGGPNDQNDLVASPASALAARLRDDGVITLLDTSNAQVIGLIGEPRAVSYGMVPGLVFDTDGSTLVVVHPSSPSGSPGVLQTWRTSAEQWMNAACRAAGRDLTADEWRQYVNDAVPDDLRCNR
jgi:hypothetical protein